MASDSDTEVPAEASALKKSIRVPASMAAPLALAIQILVAVAMFCVIAAAAIALNFATKFCENGNLLPYWIIQGMHGLEIFLWGIDALCFLQLVVVEFLKFSASVWKRSGEHG